MSQDSIKKLKTNNSHFKAWVSESDDNKFRILPLTHITLGRFARDIIIEGRINPTTCKVHNKELVYCFYGRAGYRVKGSDTISAESRLPICLVLKGDLLERARDVYPFDTGAFANSMYSDYLGSEFTVKDFSIAGDTSLPNKLIQKVYPSLETYVKGQTDLVCDPDDVSDRGQFEVQGYLKLINTKGNNSADDRIGSMEVLFSDPIPLKDDLICAIVPHTLLNPTKGQPAPWVTDLPKRGIRVMPYEFLPKRRPEFYHAEIEKLFLAYCKDQGYFNKV